MRINRFRLWVPFFIFWPLLAVIELFLMLILVPVGVVMMFGNYKKGKLVALSMPFLMEIMASARGLIIEVAEHKGNKIGLKLL